MPPKLFKKADPEVKQYGQPTPANPLDNGNKDEKDEDLKIKKPSIPGQPGNEPGNNAGNGPLLPNGNPIQADMEKEAERTLLPEQPRPKSKSQYDYDPRMQNRTMPIAQPTTRAEGAPSWVTGASRRPKLLNKNAEMSVPDKHEFRIAVQTLKMPDAMLGVMGGPSKEQALQTLARHGYRWDDADYMRGGKGLKRAAVDTTSGEWQITQTPDGSFRYVNHNAKLLTTGFGSQEGLERNADIIRMSGSALVQMQQRYAQEFPQGKSASVRKVADDYGTVADLQNFLSSFDTDAKIRFISAVSTYPQIELPIYETWNNGGVPTISLDTDPFYAHIEKLNKEMADRRNRPAAPAPVSASKKVAIGITPGVPGPDYKAVTKDKSILNDAPPAGELGGAMGPEVDKAKARRDEKRNRTRANNDLAAIGRRYHSSMPLQEMKEILAKYGFNPEAMDGIYTGEEGKMHEQAGPNTWISMTWHKMPRTGTWEIVAYLS